MPRPNRYLHSAEECPWSSSFLAAVAAVAVFDVLFVYSESLLP